MIGEKMQNFIMKFSAKNILNINKNFDYISIKSLNITARSATSFFQILYFKAVVKAFAKKPKMINLLKNGFTKPKLGITLYHFIFPIKP